MSRKHENFLRVPGGAPNEHDNTRTVYIGSRFIGGPWVAGAMNVAKKFSLGGLISLIPTPPSPTYHWCVIVGDFYHQLQATNLNGGDNYYDSNQWSSWGSWETYKVGTTTFNDVSIQMAAEKAMLDMPETYHWKDNNCQSFVVKLLDRISPGRKRVTTIFAYDAIQELPEMKLKIVYKNLNTGEVVEVDPRTREPIKEGAKFEQPEVEHPAEHIETKQAEEQKIEEILANPDVESVNLAMLIMNEKTPTITAEEMEQLKKAEVPLVLPATEADGSGVLIDGTTSLQPMWESSS